MKDKTAYFSGKMFVIDEFDKDEETLSFYGVYIKEVIYNDPATIVFWSDGTKTVSKVSGNDVYNPETGLSICIMKKLLGSQEVRGIFEDWLPSEDSPCINTCVSLRDVRKKYKSRVN